VVSMAGEETFIEAGLENGSAKVFTVCSVQRFLPTSVGLQLGAPTTHVFYYSFVKNMIDATSGLGSGSAAGLTQVINPYKAAKHPPISRADTGALSMLRLTW